MIIMFLIKSTDVLSIRKQAKRESVNDECNQGNRLCRWMKWALQRIETGVQELMKLRLA